MIFILSKDEDVLSVANNNGSPNSCPYYNDAYVQDVSLGVGTYTFYVPSNHPVANTIVRGGYVARADQDGRVRLFQISSVIETHAQGTSGAGGAGSNKEVYAVDAGLELRDDCIRPITYTNTNAHDLIVNLLVGQEWQVGNVDDGFPLQTLAYTNNETILNGLQTASTAFGGELVFRVVITNGKVTGRYVDLVKQVGNTTYKRFEYNKDMVSVQRTENDDQLATALYGVGSNNLDFKNIVWSKANGDPTDKPSGQDWIGDPDALQVEGRKGRHITRSFSYDTTDPTVLLQKTWEQLQIQKNPSLTYTMQVSLLERLAGVQHEKVRIGDTVYIVDNTFNPPLLLQARVLQLTTCFSDPMQDQVTLGNYVVVQSSISAQMRAIQSTLLQKQSNWDDAYTTANQALTNSRVVVSIKSTNGLVFRNGNVNTSLVVTVMQGESDVTTSMDASLFVWHKYDENGVEDMDWFNAHLGIGRSVSINYSDTHEGATFECDVDTSSLTS